jgi:hypothetical protein
MAKDNQYGFFRDVELDEFGNLTVNTDNKDVELLINSLSIMINLLVEEQQETNRLLRKIYSQE